MFAEAAVQYVALLTARLLVPGGEGVADAADGDIPEPEAKGLLQVHQLQFKHPSPATGPCSYQTAATMFICSGGGSQSNTSIPGDGLPD